MLSDRILTSSNSVITTKFREEYIYIQKSVMKHTAIRINMKTGLRERNCFKRYYFVVDIFQI